MKEGVGIHKTFADPIELEEEQAFWHKFIFDLHTVEGISNALFF